MHLIPLMESRKRLQQRPGERSISQACFYWRKLGFLAIALLVFSGCSSTSSVSTIEEYPVTQNEQAENEINEDDHYTSKALDERQFQIQQAEHYAELAIKLGRGQEAADASLNSAEFFVQAGEIQRAESSILALDTSKLSLQQTNRYEIIRAYAEYGRDEYVVALARVRRLLSNPANQSPESLKQRIDALLLASFSYQKIGQTEAALSALIERESLLFGPARAETSRYIWQIIKQIPEGERQQLIELAQSPQVRNRLEQSLKGEIGLRDSTPGQFNHWQFENQQNLETFPQQTNHWNLSSAKSIVVLLPENSRYHRAANVVKEGINHQHQLNGSAFKPRVEFYDVGNDPSFITHYYQMAIARGADLIIGPLGKKYADTLVSTVDLETAVPTVLLGGEAELPPKFTRIDLSPEHESEQIADYATNLGYVNAVILSPDSINGSRSAEGFRQRWLDNGGRISKTITYAESRFDHSHELKRMFDQDQSQARYRTLSDVLGYRPKFTAYKRNDIDFIYLVANNDTGRIVRPQINFFGGQDIPVISSSEIYTGAKQVAEDTDLNDTLFPIMPWEIASQDLSPYQGINNRLFALGADAYVLASQRESISFGDPFSLWGNTGFLSFDRHKGIKIKPMWADFVDGEAILVAQ